MKRRSFVQASLGGALLATPLRRLLAAAAGGQIPAVKLDGTATTLESAAISELAASLRGTLILPDHNEYESARRTWNRMIDRRPAMVVRCAGAADVANAVTFARERSLLLAVRGGGHSFPGHSTCDGGMVIDLSPMRDVRVDLARRTAVAAGGCWGRDVDGETQHYKLVTTLGQISDTGIGGLTLGGGYGWLSRKHGLACDNLVSLDVVGADGQLRRASADENPDLFWALRGGGGNFGVATAFEYRLHPLDPGVAGGNMAWSMKDGVEIANRFAELNEKAPRELSLDLSAWIEGGERYIGIDGCYAGDPATGLKLLEPLSKWGKNRQGKFEATTYQAVQRQFDTRPDGPGNHYVKAGLIREFTPEFVRFLAKDFKPGQDFGMYLQNASGAVGDVAPEATAVWNRKAIGNFMLLGAWRDTADNERNIAEIRAAWEQVAPFTAGYYANLHDTDRITAPTSHGGNQARLAAIKKKYDPQNLFRLNPNIAPA